jgi:hypothetical protein
MKKFIILLVIYSSLYSNAQNQKVALEDKILDTVLSLSEVKQEAKKVERLSHDKRHLSDVIYQKPSKDFNYYWVKVWEDNGGAYATHFNFYVQPKTLEIKFYDVVNDKLLDLKTWRILRKKN